MDLFKTDANGLLYHKWYGNGVWNGWETLGGLAVGDVSALVTAPGHAAIFVRGGDNGLYIRNSHPGGWDPWTWIASNVGGDPVAATGSGFHSVDVFYRDSVTGGLDSTWWNGTGWISAAVPVSSGVQGKPAVREAGGVIEVTVRGGGNEVYSDWFVGYWSGWADRRGQTVGDPTTSASASTGEVDLFVPGGDNNPYICNESAGCPGWYVVPGTISGSDVAAVAIAPDVTDAFFRGTDGLLRFCGGNYCAGGYTVAAGGIAGTPAALGGSNPYRFDAFVRGLDNVIYWIYYLGGWSGYQSMGNQVTGSG